MLPFGGAAIPERASRKALTLQRVYVASESALGEDSGAAQARAACSDARSASRAARVSRSPSEQRYVACRRCHDIAFATPRCSSRRRLFFSVLPGAAPDAKHRLAAG